MVNSVKKFIFIFILLVANQADSTIVINEILANEPGSLTSLEWVELYNSGASAIDLKDWKFIEENDTTVITNSILIGGKSYLVLARRLVTALGDSVSFEAHWGDASGVWGDSPEENFPALEAKMSLTNSGGTVSLVDNSGNLQSFTWNKDFGDKISWEKIDPLGPDSLSNWWRCVDPQGATPGRENSVHTTFSSNIQLKLSPNPFSPDGDGFDDELIIDYQIPLGSNLTLKIYDVKGRLVRTLMNDQPAVSGKTIWDGKNDAGKIVRTGIYVLFVQITGEHKESKKAAISVVKK